MVFHRLVGALSSSTAKGSIYAGLERFVGNKPDTFGQDESWVSFVQHLRQCRLVFLGEIHSVPAITQFQYKVVKELTPPPPTAQQGRRLHVVMEHFCFPMQPLLDDFSQGKLSFAELLEQYRREGSEGHDLDPYRALLEHVQTHPNQVKLHAGFVPKHLARLLVKEGPSSALAAGKSWFPSHLDSNSLQGSSFHYNYFDSLLTGRNMHLATSASPSNRFAGIFQAQLLKDEGMAHFINQLVNDTNENDQIIVIAGNGHVAYFTGVPERVFRAHPYLVNQTCLVTSHSVQSIHALNEQSASQLLEMLHLGGKGANPADFCFVYVDQDDDDDEEECSGGVPHSPHLPVGPSPTSHPTTLTPTSNTKEETRLAYDQVGETAHLQGNLARAQAIMTYLGYTPAEIEVAGKDAYNFQGVGNPHKHANIQPGEYVLDVGSGLGIDSFIAASKAGPEGRLIGIDIAAKEVAHAVRAAEARGLDIRFATADMERMPLPDNAFDVVISNGAFCLAPNKKAAFEEIFRVLKPGGRMVVCTSTIQKDGLDEDVEWPICMRMFIEKSRLRPLCEQIGFINVLVDDSDSKMVFELELPEEASQLNPERHRVHGDSPEFQHLEKYNMDTLCARVCVVARKPPKEEGPKDRIK